MAQIIWSSERLVFQLFPLLLWPWWSSATCRTILCVYQCGNWSKKTLFPQKQWKLQAYLGTYLFENSYFLEGPDHLKSFYCSRTPNICVMQPTTQSTRSQKGLVFLAPLVSYINLIAINDAKEKLWYPRCRASIASQSILWTGPFQ